MLKKLLVCLLTLSLVFTMSAVSFAGETGDNDVESAIILVSDSIEGQGVDGQMHNVGEVIPSDGEELEITNAPMKPALSFKDVDENDWFYGGVFWAINNNVAQGYSANRFGPNNDCTRGQLVTMLYKAEGEPMLLDMTAEGSYNELNAFKDIEKDSYYYKAVLWANAVGLVEGTGNDKFKPNAKITREQLAVIIHRYAEYKGFDMTLGDDTNILDYDDIFKTAEYAIPAFQWACGAGVIEGMGKILGSKKNATRAQVVTILYRVFNTDLMPFTLTIEDLAGDYRELTTKSALMRISEPYKDGIVNIRVSNASSSFECQVWTMKAAMEKDILYYSDCATYEFLFDSETEEDKVLYYIVPIEYDIVGYFVVKKDGSIVWEGTDDKQRQTFVFVK